MLSRRAKTTYFALTGWAMRLNGWFYRTCRAPRGGENKVQLGSGRDRYLTGWINVDANCITVKCDVWADLRNRLPFRSGTIAVFYSHHVIEHLSSRLLSFHFHEMFRCLRPGGVIRIGVPNAHIALTKYLQGNLEWFGVWPDEWASLGGRLANFLLCANEHLSILTPSFAQELCARAGFADFCVCSPRMQTNYPQLVGAEVLAGECERTPDWPHTLIFEARKPSKTGGSAS